MCARKGENTEQLRAPEEDGATIQKCKYAFKIIIFLFCVYSRRTSTTDFYSFNSPESSGPSVHITTTYRTALAQASFVRRIGHFFSRLSPIKIPRTHTPTDQPVRCLGHRLYTTTTTERRRRALSPPAHPPRTVEQTQLSESASSVMPSKAQQAADDMFAVEDLVHEIKENLRLKAPSSNSGIVLHHRTLRRPSPYSVPSRSYVATPRSGLIPCTDPSHAATGTCTSSCGAGTSTATGAGSTSSHPLLGNSMLSTATKSHCLRKRNKSTDDIDDPYEMLQALLKNNSLVKEAVRRLQLNLSPKQRYFYESDEESSRSPMMRLCQLEL